MIRCLWSRGEVVDIDVLANDVDPRGFTMSIQAHTDPEHGTLTQAGPGVFRYEPSPNFIGYDRFEYTVGNTDGMTDTASVEIAVVPPGGRPRMVPPTPETGTEFRVWEGEVISFPIAAVDPDQLALTYRVQPLPAELVDQQTGTFTWHTDWRDVGEHRLEIIAKSADGDLAVRRVTGRVISAHTDDDGLSDSRETAHGLDPAAEDSDGDGLDDDVEWGNAAAEDGPPDTDGDGLNDALDTDSDDDGLADGEDACRLEAGAGVDGCPTSDRVNWGEDTPSSSRGCQTTPSSVTGSAGVFFVILLGLGYLRRQRFKRWS